MLSSLRSTSTGLSLHRSVLALRVASFPAIELRGTGLYWFSKVEPKNFEKGRTLKVVLLNGQNCDFSNISALILTYNVSLPQVMSLSHVMRGTRTEGHITCGKCISLVNYINDVSAAWEGRRHSHLRLTINLLNQYSPVPRARSSIAAKDATRAQIYAGLGNN